jgi:hypothetical protein
LMKAFLMTYRSFMKPIELAEKLILRYCTTPNTKILTDADNSSLLSLNKTRQVPIRLRFSIPLCCSFIHLSNLFIFY